MIKLKSKDGKSVVEVHSDIQASPFLREGFVPATKADEAKLKGEKPTEE